MNIDLRATALLACVLAAACSASSETPCVLPASTRTLPAALHEASGAVLDRAGTLWVIADSGEPVLYAIGENDRIIARVRIADARIRDWEGLAHGPCPAGECLFVGDIGDNLHEHGTGLILRIPQPPARDTTVTAERFRFRYPDGPSDAEALTVLADGSLIIITKGRNRAVGVYRYPPPLRSDQTVTLLHVQDLTPGIVQLPQQPTGTATLESGAVLVRTYGQLRRYLFQGDTLAPVGRPIDLRALDEPQGEGVAAGPGGEVVLVGEHGGGGTIARLQCVFEEASGGTDDAPSRE